MPKPKAKVKSASPATPEAEARTREVLTKYTILNPDGTPRQVNLTAPVSPGDRQAPGAGPLVAQNAVDLLCAADTTPNKIWLDWIFFQAGGGQQAKDRSADSLKSIKDRFIDERTNGFTNPDTGAYQPPVPRAQAEARWAANEPRFTAFMAVCDQDTVNRLKTFGFFREWPGNGNIYAKVAEAVADFLELFPKLQEMNRELAREDEKSMLPETPAEIPTVPRMEEITKKVERYFASKVARTDVRAETVYDDDTIAAVAPFTYAAAVRYGFDIWPWANRKNFDDVLTGDPADYRRSTDHWKAQTSKGNVIIYLRLKTPVPAWVARRNGEWTLHDLADMALVLEPSQATSNYNSWTVYDQENRNELTIEQVKAMIMAEPDRQDPADVESPIGRGGNAYRSNEEAAAVVAALDRALAAVKKWLPGFKHSTIKSDAMTLD